MDLVTPCDTDRVSHDREMNASVFAKARKGLDVGCFQRSGAAAPPRASLICSSKASYFVVKNNFKVCTLSYQGIGTQILCSCHDGELHGAAAAVTPAPAQKYSLISFR